MDALNNLIIPVLWNKFVNMDRETFIETQALTLGETPTFSIGGREGKIEDEEGDKTEDEEETR